LHTVSILYASSLNKLNRGEMKMENIQLSEDLEYWRAERPDEWVMDRFIRKATNLEHAIDYYRCSILQSSGEALKPPYIPCRVKVYKKVSSDFVFPDTKKLHIDPGEYDCRCNQYGAVIVKTKNGEDFGLRISEFEPIKWIKNPIGETSPTENG
jgi:hypothetical protein